MNDRKALQMLKAVADRHPDAAYEIGSVADYIWDCAALVSEMQGTIDLMVSNGTSGAILQDRVTKIREKSQRLFGR